MEWINEKAKLLSQGAIRDMFDRALKMDNVISLGLGEPDMTTPEDICRAATEAMTNGFTHYTANPGLLECRRAVAKYLQGLGQDYDPETEVMLSPGGMSALSQCLNVVLNPGDEVIMQDPQWTNYTMLIRYADGKPVFVPAYAEHNFVMQARDIEDRLTSHTKVIMINYPNNPTGGVATREQLQAIADVAIKYDLLVISDEVYRTLLFDGLEFCSIANLPRMRERTVVINSFSKSFAMTGWRVGMAAGPASIIKRMCLLQENSTVCVNAIAQKAVAYAVTRPDLVSQMRDIYEQRRNYFVPALNSIDKIECGEVHGAFYTFPSIKATGLSSTEFCDRLLDEEHVVCVPGCAFGEHGEGYVRISFCNSMENLQEAIERIRRFVSRL